MAYLLGLDVSTIGAQALPIDPRGPVAISATADYSPLTPYPLWPNPAPDNWPRRAHASIKPAQARES